MKAIFADEFIDAFNRESRFPISNDNTVRENLRNMSRFADEAEPETFRFNPFQLIEYAYTSIVRAVTFSWVEEGQVVDANRQIDRALDFLEQEYNWADSRELYQLTVPAVESIRDRIAFLGTALGQLETLAPDKYPLLASRLEAKDYPAELSISAAREASRPDALVMWIPRKPGTTLTFTDENEAIGWIRFLATTYLPFPVQSTVA